MIQHGHAEVLDAETALRWTQLRLIGRSNGSVA
jgi:hypothetical protein